MKETEKYLRDQVGLPDGKLVPGVYTNGFVSFTIQHILEGRVLLYANTDIPYLEISEDEPLEIGERDLEKLFGDLLADFRLTYAGTQGDGI
jgi:hypothetical protein